MLSQPAADRYAGMEREVFKRFLQPRLRLIELGCPVAQGYYYARPMPVDEAIAWAGARLRR